MYAELVKRLREKAGAFDYDGWVETASDYEQAADAIEELTAIREEQKAQIIAMAAEIEEQQPRWIPVTERLPDFEGCLLCMRKAFVGDKLRYLDILYYEEGTFYMEFEDTPIPTEAITHWMPLPQPPKEE